MKKLSFFCLGLLLLVGQTSYSQVTDLSPNDFEVKMAAMKPQILDVRTAREYQSSHIKDALQADWTNMTQFVDRVQYLDKSKPLFIYCASGGRSGEALKWLQNQGFIFVQNLKGGLTEWKIEGKPVVSPTPTAQMTTTMYLGLTQTADQVLVDFGAEWCPPCRKMEPVLAQLQKEVTKPYKFVKVDGGQDIEVMKAYKVEAIPTFIIYKKGKEVYRKQGLVTIDELKAQLQ